MYGHNNHYTYGTTSADHFLSHQPSLDTAVTPLPPPSFPSLPPLTVPTGYDYGYNSSSGCSSYESPSSHTSYSTPSPSLIQRSLSSHSLPKNINPQLIATSPAEYLELDTSPVRRVFSTGDLQGINMMQHYHRSESPLSNENSSIIESMGKACRYSPEEKKERIERYRSKRTQRNFNKKIKYVCRKTLADSRPRIRGRFARNDELEKISQAQWSQAGLEEEEEDDEYWMKLLNSFSGNVLS